MKKSLLVAGALLAMPLTAQAQEFAPLPGFYVGAGAGGVWYLNSTTSIGGSFSSTTGALVDIVAGYDFVGPRVELEVGFGFIPFTANLAGTAAQSNFTGSAHQLHIMGKALYDFIPASTITPYIGAGAGIAFVDGNSFLQNTVFAYEGILGVGYNIDSQWRVALEGRYVGTTNANVVINGVNVGVNNSNIVAMLYGQYKFAPPVAPPPPAPATVAPPSFMVFFDWDSASISEASLNVIRQAAGAFKSKGSARIRATGHTDTSGPEAYNMALSLRRANAVKNALVREGVPAAAITVIGRGEQGLLVPTADGVREPQNRRVEIVIE
ncbi:MAG: OmpA family protein [Reyranella sp.]|jgi:OOP family OmpA-OmpF porin|nr:OmpA family protein [Reyranella sp.]